LGIGTPCNRSQLDKFMLVISELLVNSL